MRPATQAEVIVYSICMVVITLFDLILVPWYIMRRHKNPIRPRPLPMSIAHRGMMVTMIIIGLARIVPEKVYCGWYVTAMGMVCVFGGVSDCIKLVYVWIMFFSGKEATSRHQKLAADLMKFSTRKMAGYDALNESSDAPARPSHSPPSSENSKEDAAQWFSKRKKQMSHKNLALVTLAIELPLILLAVILVYSWPNNYHMQLVVENNCNFTDTVPVFSLLLVALIMVPLHFTMKTKLQFVEDNFGMREEFKDLMKPVSILSVVSVLSMIPSVYRQAWNTFLWFDLVLMLCSLIACVNIIGKPLKLSYSPEFDQVQETGSISTTEAKTASTVEMGDMKATRSKMFTDFLIDKQGHEMFKEFLIRELSVENILFWQAAYMFRTIFSQNSDGLTSKEEMRRVATLIFNSYVHNTAVDQVNLPMTIYKEINDAVREDRITPDLFAKAELEILNLMLSDPFRRFVHTSQFKEYAKEKMEFQGLGSPQRTNKESA